MKIIPVYSWTKGVVALNRRRETLAKQPWFQGVLLLVCVVLAMLFVNLPWTKDLYKGILETNIQIHLFNAHGIDVLFPRDMTFEALINDILMVFFFFTVGLEIKREIAHGELSSAKKAMMPVIAAFGGVVAPALIYFAVNCGTTASGGWGIPTATDIAFAVCILSVLGDRVPVSAKVFLTALAIADDLIAILVVALFYGGDIDFLLLGLSVLVMLFTVVLRRVGEKRMFPYIFCAVVVWVLFYYSGIHATMSGVVMAFLIPSSPRYNRPQYLRKRDQYMHMFDQCSNIDDEPFPNGLQKHCLRKIQDAAYGTMDMSYRVEHALSPWVNYLIMPIFALANAGVEITSIEYFNVFSYDAALGGVGMGIFLGLVLGKPVGITLFSLAAIKARVGEMPARCSWPMFFAVACLGGIGFTMSIFVDTLSFSDVNPETAARMRDAGKIAVLMGSLCSGVLGSLLVTAVSGAKKKEA